MKKIVAAIALFLGFTAVALAIPARPGARPVRQPDGSVIMLTLNGDEYCHWVTDASGTIVEKGEDGFWRPSRKTISEHRTALSRRSVISRSKWSSYDSAPQTNFGDRKILAILVNFTDSTFVLNDPRTRFDNLLNQEGYSENGGHGSVRDYYVQNSLGLYRPHFDVYGPVNLSHSSAYYDQTSSVAEAIYEACQMLDSQVDFSQYDTDSDGTIDMILLYYAGHNEAEGAGEESIWPHQSSGYGTFDGVNIGNYFCTSELSNASGTNMCGIGTTTHEFAHSLGLPDFYDTDYEKNGGMNGTTNWYDVMCRGPYLDDGKCPPYFSAVERNMLGWMPEPEVLSSLADINLSPVQENAAYKVLTENEGEYFILEARNGAGWDSALPDTGLLVYHVDQSQNSVNGRTAAYLWESTNKINAYYGHPCFYIMTDTGGLPDSTQWKNMCLGGQYAGKNLNLRRWSGDEVGMMIQNVVLSGAGVSFHASYFAGAYLSGIVTDTSDNPLAGVQVTLSKSAYPFAGVPSVLPTDLVAVTDSYGGYMIDISGLSSTEHVVSFRKDGFITVSENITIEDTHLRHNVTLFGKQEGPKEALYKFNPDGEIKRGGFSSAGSYAVALRYTADEISENGYAGAKLKAIEMAVADAAYTDAYLLVYFGDENVLSQKFEIKKYDSFQSYDISSYDLVIPEGKDVYIGYGLTNLEAKNHPFYMISNGGTSAGGNFARKDFNTTPSGWRNAWTDSDFMIYAHIEYPGPELTLASYDVAFVRLEDGVPVAVPSDGKTLKDSTWYLDGTAVDTPPAVSSLSAGSHTYKVVLRYYDGTSETVWFDVAGE